MMNISAELQHKIDILRDNLRRSGGGVLAYSGGVDSTLLACIAVEELGPRVVLVTATSPTYTPDELKQAQSLAERFRARLRIIETDEFNDPRFAGNPPDRCYICKGELFSKLELIRREEGLEYIFDGTNADDSGDYRPGSRAAREYSVLSPLREAGLTKAEIRMVSKELGLPTWDQPAKACLASRFPYGTELTPEAMRNIAAAEADLSDLGFALVRVRHHGDTARIEVAPEDIARLARAEIRDKVVAKIRSLGYKYVAADLQGYRTGSMNETLDPETINSNS